MIKTGKNAWYTVIPMIFLLVITVWALILFITPWLPSLDPTVNGIVAIILLLITGVLIFEAYRAIMKQKGKNQE
jgi:carbon starvation protein CstA